MKTLLRTLVPVLFVGAILGSTREAHALGPVGIEVGAQVGGGSNPNGDLPNALGVGIGARGGVTLFGGLYGGVKIMDYLGASKNASIGTSGVSFKAHSLQEGVDVGWGFKLAILTIRPQVGLGNITISPSYDGNLGTAAATLPTNSYSSFYFEPGVTGLISLGLLYIGADVNYLYITKYPADDGSTKGAGGLTIHGQIGVQF